MKTFPECCREVAKKHNVEEFYQLVIHKNHDAQLQYYKEAAEMYAKEVAVAALKYVADIDEWNENDGSLKYTLIDNNWYWDSDKDGDQPLTEEELFENFDRFRKEKGV